MSGIIRVYKRDEEGTLHFREAWFDEDYSQFVMNHGVVGHQSTTDETDVDNAEAAERLMDAFAVQCAEDGYAEIPERGTVLGGGPVRAQDQGRDQPGPVP